MSLSSVHECFVRIYRYKKYPEPDNLFTIRQTHFKQTVVLLPVNTYLSLKMRVPVFEMDDSVRSRKRNYLGMD